MKAPFPAPVPKPAPKVQFRRILFATDLGVASEQAQLYAAQLARLLGAHLFILHVEPGNSENRDNREECKIDALREFFQVSRLPFTLILERGSIEEILNRVANECSVDLIIVGTHAWHGIPYLVHGSVSETLTRSSFCPVIAVGPRVRNLADSVRTIVYATDFSDESTLALPFALSLAQGCQASLIVLHVAPLSGNLKCEPNSPQAPLLSRLKNLTPQDGSPWHSVRHLVTFGGAKEKILDIAGSERADLIVLGLHSSVPSRSNLRERLSYRILCDAPCPVLSVAHSRNVQPAHSSTASTEVPAMLN